MIEALGPSGAIDSSSAGARRAPEPQPDRPPRPERRPLEEVRGVEPRTMLDPETLKIFTDILDARSGELLYRIPPFGITEAGERESDLVQRYARLQAQARG